MSHDDEQSSAAEDLRQWLDEAAVPSQQMDVGRDGTVARRSRRRTAVAAAIAIPWVFVLVIVLSGGAATRRDAALPAHRATSRAGSATGSVEPVTEPSEQVFGLATETAVEPAGTATAPGATSAAPGESATESGAPAAASGEPANDPDAPTAAPREPANDPGAPAGGQRQGVWAAAGPVAVSVVRDAVTSTGDTTASALDVAAAEPPQRLTDDTWILRVHAVVLSGDRRHWRSASHEIWAVPIGDRAGDVVVLDRPWRVARGTPPSAPVRWRPAQVDIADVRAALRRAGLPAPRDIGVERHPDLSGVLRTTAQSREGTSRVWLQATPELMVLGDRAGVRP